jgi:hypothetical protein
MMETVDDRKLENLAGLGCSDRATRRRILVQRPVRSPGMVITEVRRQHSLEMPFVENDDVIQELSTKATDHTFNISVLPR